MVTTVREKKQNFPKKKNTHTYIDIPWGDTHFFLATNRCKSSANGRIHSRIFYFNRTFNRSILVVDIMYDDEYSYRKKQIFTVIVIGLGVFKKMGFYSCANWGFHVISIITRGYWLLSSRNISTLVIQKNHFKALIVHSVLWTRYRKKHFAHFYSPIQLYI